MKELKLAFLKRLSTRYALCTGWIYEIASKGKDATRGTKGAEVTS